MAGRSSKYKNADEYVLTEDGDAYFSDSTVLKSNDFKSEKEMRECLLSQIEYFTENILNDKLISFSEEVSTEVRRLRFAPRAERIDVVINGERSNYYIELKNPKATSENRYGLGQILCYDAMFLDPKKEMILLTSCYDLITQRAIQKHNLPIRYIFFDRKKTMEFKEYVTTT